MSNNSSESKTASMPDSLETTQSKDGDGAPPVTLAAAHDLERDQARDKALMAAYEQRETKRQIEAAFLAQQKVINDAQIVKEAKLLRGAKRSAVYHDGTVSLSNLLIRYHYGKRSKLYKSYGIRAHDGKFISTYNPAHEKPLPGVSVFDTVDELVHAMHNYRSTIGHCYREPKRSQEKLKAKYDAAAALKGHGSTVKPIVKAWSTYT